MLLGLTAIVVGVYSVGDRSKRNAALQALSTHHVAAATPEAVVTKAEEAQRTITKPPPGEGDPQPAEAETNQSAAYDPVTGEINWDCPCLGGMAHGPCGEQFKTAFTCFVHSDDEIKGADCIDAFRAMQDCFREHPEHYADQLRDDADDDDDDFEHVEAPSSNAVVDSVSDAASSLSSSVSSAVSSVGSALSGSSGDEQPASSSGEHKSRSATPAPQHKGSAFDLDTQRHGGPQPAGAGRIGPSYSGTTNHTAGESDHLGRNAASGSRPSGKSEAAHAAHRESVEKTRAGEHAVGDKGGFPRG